MPFDGTLPREMSRLDKLVHLRGILNRQTNEDQLDWNTCLHHSVMEDACFRSQPGFNQAFRDYASGAFQYFFSVDHDDATYLVSAKPVRKKRRVLNRLIREERVGTAHRKLDQLREAFFGLARRAQPT